MTQARGFADPTVLDQRREMLTTSETAAPLNEWLAEVRATRPNDQFPDFDPAEAGVDARVLFIGKAPSGAAPIQENGAGSGFISVDNDDDSAEINWRFRDEAGIGHEVGLQWNIVPWWAGRGAKGPTAADYATGAKHLRQLLRLLPRVEVIALCGKEVQNAWARNGGPTNAVVVPMPMPTPLAVKQAGKEQELRAGMRRVRGLIG